MATLDKTPAAPTPARGQEIGKDIGGDGDLLGSTESSLGHRVRFANMVLQRELASQISKLGISLMEWYTLRTLWECDQLSQAELAERSGIPGSGMVGAVQSLMAKGHIVRERCSLDKRKFIISLTASGRALQEPGIAASVEGNRIATEGVSEADLMACLRVLRAAEKNLKR